MNKSQLIKRVAEDNRISQVAATALVESALGHIGGAIAKGERVDLHGFGIFSVKQRAARAGRNPATGANIMIPEKVLVGFKASKTLLEKL